jgi:hypothetical protein
MDNKDKINNTGKSMEQALDSFLANFMNIALNEADEIRAGKDLDKIDPTTVVKKTYIKDPTKKDEQS